MGYYIETDVTVGKANWLVENCGAEKIKKIDNFNDIPEEKGLVLVVSNTVFDAACFIYSPNELNSWLEEEKIDPRQREYLLMDLNVCKEMSGYKH